MCGRTDLERIVSLSCHVESMRLDAKVVATWKLRPGMDAQQPACIGLALDILTWTNPSRRPFDVVITELRDFAASQRTKE